MLTAFWDGRSLVHAEFGADAYKKKRNVTQGSYLDTLMHLRNTIQPMRQGLLSQKVVLIHENARPHRVQLIRTLLENFHQKQFKHPPYSSDLVPSDYHLFPLLKKELEGECFQTQGELISTVANIFTKLR